MADLSKYTMEIVTEEDRPLFQEAEAAALHGASRGAYILIWIACAEGLKRKFGEAAVRDHQANQILGDIAQKEAQQRSVDMFILTSAKDYSFIDDVALQKLEYVYKMRCIYGHPYEAAPDDEEWFLSEFLLSVGCDFYSAAQWHDFAAKYPKIIQHVILSNRNIFEAVGERARDYIVSYNITQAATRPSRLKDIEKLVDDGLLSDEQKKSLQSLDILVVKAANLKMSTCYGSIISALKSYNWNKQNPAVDLIIANGKGGIAVLSPEQQEELGRNILQAACGPSHSALAYLSAIHDDPRGLTQHFLKGLIFEAFVNEKRELRFKKERMAVVLDLLTKQKDIEAELVEAIDASKSKDWMYESVYHRVLDLVKERSEIQSLAEASTLYLSMIPSSLTTARFFLRLIGRLSSDGRASNPHAVGLFTPKPPISKPSSSASAKASCTPPNSVLFW